MIDALLAGRIYGTPQSRTTTAGKPYATVKLRIATREGEALFANVIAFKASVVAALLALADGDSAAISGELTPKVYTDKEGNARPSLDLLAHAVLTEYHVARKRKAMLPEPSQDRPFSDELPDMVGRS